MHFKSWEQYFLSNRNHFDHIDWNENRSLTPAERKAITASLSQFQRGEHSEGKHFIQFAGSLNDESYTSTIKVFIKEEQDHAMVLGRFMEMQGMEKLRHHWLDAIFRRLRILAGLEGTVTVLLTAEIIAMVYYKALNKATRSELLQQLCTQILVDEEMHLRFQSYTLQQVYSRKSRLSVGCSRFLHKVLMAGTIVMVWATHYKVVKAGGYTLFSFARENWFEFMKCERMIKGKNSSFPVTGSLHHAIKISV